MADPNAMDVDQPGPSSSQSADAIVVTESSVLIHNIVTAVPGTEPVSTPTMDADWANHQSKETPANGHNLASAAAGISLTSSMIPPNGQETPSLQSSGLTTVTHRNATLLAVGNGTAADDQEVARMPRTGYVYDPLMMLHCHDSYTPTPDTDQAGKDDLHPEEPMRIKRIYTRLRNNGLIRRMKQLSSKEASFEQVTLVHDEEHWMKIHGTETMTDEQFVDTRHYYEGLSLYVCRETARCARLSCGGVIQACTSVCTGEVRNAFAIVRPPGHHAEPDEHMGFCFFNNVAVAAREMQKQGLAKKVLILDWDVHHGNGTQRAFWEDETVLYISLHRHDGGRFYPSSDFGALNMVGEGKAKGTSVNIPWPTFGFGDADYMYAFQHIVMPIAYEFNPDLVIISAGFDAAEGDQLGLCNVTPAGYGHMTHMLSAVAGGKVVVALEGGYNLDAISVSALAVAQVLLGETPEELGSMQASDLCVEVVNQVAKAQSKYWKNIDLKACEPPEVGSANDASVVTIPDILKVFRGDVLRRKHGLFPIPLANLELEEAFSEQIFSNMDLAGSSADKPLVLFVHDFGNLRVERNSSLSSDAHMTNSYLLDTSDTVVKWVINNRWDLIDVNVLRQLPTSFAEGPKMVSNRGDPADGELLRYLWENLIELSETQQVVLIGHGTGCQALMELVNLCDVEQRVKAVVQVGGLHSLVRVDPHNESKRNWFKMVNRVYVPNIHPLLNEERLHRRLGGQINTSQKAQVVDVLVDVFPQIQEFVESKLPKPTTTPAPSSNGNSNGNGHADAAMPQPQPVLA